MPRREADRRRDKDAETATAAVDDMAALAASAEPTRNAPVAAPVAAWSDVEDRVASEAGADYETEPQQQPAATLVTKPRRPSVVLATSLGAKRSGSYAKGGS